MKQKTAKFDYNTLSWLATGEREVSPAGRRCWVAEIMLADEWYMVSMQERMPKAVRLETAMKHIKRNRILYPNATLRLRNLLNGETVRPVEPVVS